METSINHTQQNLMKLKLPFVFIILISAGIMVPGQNAHNTHNYNVEATTPAELLFEELLNTYIEKYEVYYSENRAKGHTYLKSEQSNKIDSIILEERRDINQPLEKYQRTRYNYDADGEILEMKYDIFDIQVNDWVNSSKTEVTREVNTENTVYTSYKWDMQLKEWKPTRKERNEYDSSGRVIISEMKHWDNQLNEWYVKYKRNYEFNTEGEKMSYEMFWWDEREGKFLIARRYEYTYDNKELILMITCDDEGGVWIEKKKNVYNYDDKGFRVSVELFDRIIDPASWQESQRYNYVNNEKGKVIQFTSLKWDESLNDWENIEKTEYSVDKEGNVLEEVSYIWNITEWTNLVKKVSTYNTNRDILSQYSYDWSSATLEWKGSKKESRLYNENGRQISKEEYYWNNTLNDWEGVNKYCQSYYDDGANKLYEQYRWDDTSADWYILSRSTVYYEPKPTAIDDLVSDSYHIYPNPSYGNVNITGETGTEFTVRIFNMAGAILTQLESNASHIRINLNELGAKGIYLLELTDTKSQITEVRKVALK